MADPARAVPAHVNLTRTTAHPSHASIPALGPKTFAHVFRTVVGQGLYNVPNVFSSVAELAAGNARRKTVVADGNLLVYVLIGKVVGALSHGTDKDTYALLGLKVLNIVARPHNLLVETESNLAAIWR